MVNDQTLGSQVVIKKQLSVIKMVPSIHFIVIQMSFEGILVSSLKSKWSVLSSNNDRQIKTLILVRCHLKSLWERHKDKSLSIRSECVSNKRTIMDMIRVQENIGDHPKAIMTLLTHHLRFGFVSNAWILSPLFEYSKNS